MSKEQFLKENQKDGEVYTGLILGKDGEADYHLFLIASQKDRILWANAMEWAKSVGGELPTCREQSLQIAKAILKLNTIGRMSNMPRMTPTPCVSTSTTVTRAASTRAALCLRGPFAD